MVTTQILVVDDSAPWRLLVSSILERTSSLKIVGEASDGVEAIEKAVTLHPDVVILDIGMPRLNGIEAAKKIRQASPKSKIIFLTQENDSDVQSVALNTGAAPLEVNSRCQTSSRNRTGYALDTKARSAGPHDTRTCNSLSGTLNCACPQSTQTFRVRKGPNNGSVEAPLSTAEVQRPHRSQSWRRVLRLD